MHSLRRSGFLAAAAVLAVSAATAQELRSDYTPPDRAPEGSVMRTLQMTPDAMDTSAPGRTVLDNTLIYVFSEVADGANHNSNKDTVWIDGKPTTSFVPLVTIGGGAGACKTGRLFDFENRTHGDLLYTLSEIAGVPQSQFGTSITEVKA